MPPPSLSHLILGDEPLEVGNGRRGEELLVVLQVTQLPVVSRLKILHTYTGQEQFQTSQWHTLFSRFVVKTPSVQWSGGEPWSPSVTLHSPASPRCSTVGHSIGGEGSCLIATPTTDGAVHTHPVSPISLDGVHTSTCQDCREGRGGEGRGGEGRGGEGGRGEGMGGEDRGGREEGRRGEGEGRRSDHEVTNADTLPSLRPCLMTPPISILSLVSMGRHLSCPMKTTCSSSSKLTSKILLTLGEPVAMVAPGTEALLVIVTGVKELCCGEIENQSGN